MELNDLSFDRLHKIAFSIVAEDSCFQDEKYFSIIGKWYFKWHISDLKEFSLKVPGYTKGPVLPLVHYLFWLDALLKIQRYKPITNLVGYSLFDIMKFRSLDKYQRRGGEFKISYIRSKNMTHYFENATVVAIDRFVPLFPSDQITYNKDILFEFFELIILIAQSNLIPYPISIDLLKGITLVIVQSDLNLGDKVLAKSLVTDGLLEDRDGILNALEEIDVVSCIIFTYPYHGNIGSVVFNEFRDRAKIFSLDLAYRFSYQDIEEQQVIITNSEIGVGSTSEIIGLANSFDVIDTKCDARLVRVLSEIRDEWRKNYTNKFASPSPFKWFMYLHTGVEVEYWIKQFSFEFSQVSGFLLDKCVEAIRLIYQLDWIKNFLPTDKEAVLILPSSLILKGVVGSLTAHLTSSFFHVGHISTISNFRDRDITVLDAFNIILLNNLFGTNNLGMVTIKVPDFIYYTYQPFASYLTLQYYFKALTSGARSKLDDSYDQNLRHWCQLQELQLSKDREALKKFKNVKAVLDETAIDQVDFDLPEIIYDLSDSEIVQMLDRKESRSNSSSMPIEVITSNNRNYSLSSSSRVLIKYHGRLICGKPADLSIGQFFLPISEIIKGVDIKNMVDNLLTISKKAKNWHQDLNEHYENDSNLYDRLFFEGISVSRYTFRKEYTKSKVSDVDLHLPRSKNDWNIVCKFLSIEDRQLAWNAIRCRQDINRLKNGYNRIVEMMINTGNFGINVNAGFLADVTKILDEIVLTAEKDDQTSDDALRLIVEISNKINLELITHIIPQRFNA